MGRFGGILTNIQRLSCILIGCILYGMVKKKYRTPVAGIVHNLVPMKIMLQRAGYSCESSAQLRCDLEN